MMAERKPPQDCHALIRDEGYLYLDVRSEPEFAEGHPEGAYNIPFALATESGMQPNPDFVHVVKANFARDAKLVLG